MTGATAWASCGNVSNGSALTSATPNCVSAGDRYLQYQASLATSDVGQTPTLDDITLAYKSYPMNLQNLLSSPFDSGNKYTSLGNLTWNSTGDSAGEIKFQIRSAPGLISPDWNSADASGWCGPGNCNPSKGDSDFATDYYDSKTANTINAANADHSGNRWIQYAMFLKSNDGSATPVLTDNTVYFSFNNPPVIDVTNASQLSSGADTGKVRVDYTMQESAGEQTEAYPALFYNLSGLTLQAATSEFGAENIIINNPNQHQIPASGKILVDSELIGYTGKNDISSVQFELTGVTRGEEFLVGNSYYTEAGAHLAAAEVFWRASSVSGEINVSLPTNTASKSVIWDAKSESGLDLNNKTTDNVKVLVAANDNDAYGNRVGSDQSSVFSLDFVAPTIQSISSDHLDGSFNTGEIIDIDVVFSEPINVSGAVVTTSTNYQCLFNASASAQGSCDYVVQDGDDTNGNRLNVISVAGSISDVYGNAMVNFSPLTNFADNKNIIIDTIAEVPLISSPAQDAHINIAEVTFALQEELQSGIVKFIATTFLNGESGTPHTYNLAGAELTTLTDQTVVVPGLIDGNTYTLSFDGFDLAGNDMPNNAVTGIVFDTTDPSISITAPGSGESINSIQNSSDISYDVDEKLSGSGKTYIKFTGTAGADLGTAHTCNLSGTELEEGSHNNVDMVAVCGGFSLVDGSKYAIDFHAEDLAGNQSDALQINNVTYDITAPSLSSFNSDTPNPVSAYGTGQDINIKAVYDENVQAGSALTVRLTNNANPPTDVILNQISGNEISGTYTVQGPNLGHDSSDLGIASIISESVSDVAGNVRTGSSLPLSQNLSDNKDLVIDTGPPVLNNFSATQGAFKEGQSVTITATYSENLAAGSYVNVKMNTDQGLERNESLSLSTVSGNKLSGTYVVGSSHNAENLRITSIESQNAVDPIGNPLNTTNLPAVNLSGTQIDTTAPVLGATPISINAPGGKTSVAVLAFNLSATDNFDLSDGFVRFSLNGGVSWCSQLNYAASVNFDITSSACGGSIGNGIKTVSVKFEDIAGNESALSQVDVELDSQEPQLQSITSPIAPGIYGPGSNIAIIATYNENVSAGTLIVNLNNGVTVTLDSVSANTLSGVYTVGATGSGEDNIDLSVSTISSQSVSDFSSPANVLTSASIAGLSENIGTNNNITIDTTAPNGLITVDRSKDSGQISISATDSNQNGIEAEVVSVNSDLDVCSFAGSWVDYATNMTSDLVENSSVARKACVKFKDQSGNESLIYSAITPGTPSNIKYVDIIDKDDTPPFYGEFIRWPKPDKEGSGGFGNYDLKGCSVQKDDADCSPVDDMAVVADKDNNFYLHKDLDINRKYCYKLKIGDLAGNISKYSETTCIVPDQGTVLADSDVVISDVVISSVTNTGAQISFITKDANDFDAPLPTQVEVRVYSDEQLLTQVGSVFTDIDSSYAVNHIVKITGLQTGVNYYLKVKATDASDQNNPNRSEEIGYDAVSNSNLSFTTKGSISTITLISDDVTTMDKAVIEFRTDQEAKCFIEYKRPIDSQKEGTTLLESEFKKSHSITINSLLFPDSTYNYDITCQDSGSVFAYLLGQDFKTTDKLTGQGDIEGGKDTTSPEISSVSISQITGERAIIEWKTNEKANSIVVYSLDGSDFSKIAGNSDILTSITNYSTAHTVTISDLIPASKYNFSVVSSDGSGNISQSPQTTFTTKEPSSLSSVKVTSKALNQATISWITGENTTSIVEYGLTTLYGETKKSNAKTKEHEITIPDLQSGKTYHFRVKGEDGNGNLFASNDNTFEPKSPPKISDFKIDQITEHEARVTFITNVPTDTLVEYIDSEKTENSGVQGKADFSTKHELILKNLASGREFGVKLKVRDEEGNETEEIFQKFETSEDKNAPKIEQVRTDSALTQSEKVQSIISWKTDENADTRLIYKEGKSGKETEIKVSEVSTTSHIAVITTFKPGTVYYFNAISVDDAGNEARSGDFVLLTPKRKENIIQIIVNNFQDIFGWAQR